MLKYDVEVSGFGSQALGHVCLLNLRDQTYPGSEGTKTKGWPTWTTPLMRWAKDQGASPATPIPPTACGIEPEAGRQAAHRRSWTPTRTANSRAEEAKGALLAGCRSTSIDTNKDGFLTERN